MSTSRLLDPAVLATLPPDKLAYLRWQLEWTKTARPAQIPPSEQWSECGYLAGRGFGKALALDTPVPTPTGWSTMGALVDGDQVFDEQGRACRVVKAHEPYTPAALYRLVFSDGSAILADGDHLWITLTHADRKQFLRHGVERVPADWPAFRMPTWDRYGNVTGLRGADVRSTHELAATLTYGRRGDLNHCVPLAAPLQLPDADLPIDPWLLGYWLGNGASRDGSLYAGSYAGDHDDTYVLSRVPQGARATRIEGKGHTRIAVPGLVTRLRELGVLHNKHVPRCYCRASAQQRLELLRGLCDSDAHAAGSNVEFCSTNRDLADGVFELAASLGERPVLYEDRARLNNVDHGERYRVVWRGRLHNPFGLPRKAARMAPLGKQAMRADHRMLVSADPVPVQTVRCITVDSPNALYLVGRGMIPTHNTRVGAEWLARAVYEDASGFDSCVIAPTYGDVKFTCFEGESGLLSVLPPELLVEYNKTDLVIRMRNITGGVSAIRGFTAEKPERLRGPQHTRAWCFVAGTSVATPSGEAPIETLRPGDMVLTRQGPRRVLANSVREAPVGVVQVGSRFLVGTADHPVYLPHGWTRMDQLQVGDHACVIVASSGEGNGGTGTETGITSARTSPCGRNARCACTARSGCPKSGASPTAGTYTTETRTRATTTSVIWNACRKATTKDTTLQKNQFCLSTGLRALWSRASALIAAHGTRVNAPRATQCATGANKNGPTRSGVCRERAAAAESLSSLGWELSAASVVSTWRPTGRQSVYCLKVEGAPEYFANGVLVHNCDELAAWMYDEHTWDMAMFGLRLGAHPQVLWTTTPKPKELIRKLTQPQDGRVIVRGSTYDNRANLPKSFFKQLEQYEGTTIGRQELHGELIDPEEAGIIRRSWFRLWPAKTPLPTLEFIILSLDTAFTEATYDKKTGDADATACVVMGVFRERKTGAAHLMVLDCWSDRMGMPDLIKRVKRELNVAYGDDQDAAVIKPMFGSAKPLTSGRKPDICLIEDKGSGISLRQMLESEGIEAYAYNPGRADKLSRLHLVSHVFARRRVWLPESDKYPGKPRTWVEPMLAQLCAFTGEGSVKHDDYVDAMTQAVRLCLDKGLVSVVKASKAPETPRDDAPLVNPYAA